MKNSGLILDENGWNGWKYIKVEGMDEMDNCG